MLYKVIRVSEGSVFPPLYLESSMPEDVMEGVICALQYFYEALHDIDYLSGNIHYLRRNCLVYLLTSVYDAVDVTALYDSVAAGAQNGSGGAISNGITTTISNSGVIDIDFVEALDFWGWSVSSRYECMKRFLPKDKHTHERVRDALLRESFL